MSKANEILEKLIHLTNSKKAVKAGFYLDQLDLPLQTNGQPKRADVMELHRTGQLEFSPRSNMVRLPQYEGSPAKQSERLVRGRDGVYSLREVG